MGICSNNIFHKSGIIFIFFYPKLLDLFPYLLPHLYVKLVNEVKVDPNAPFSIATKMSWRRRYSFPWISPYYEC